MRVFEPIRSMDEFRGYAWLYKSSIPVKYTVFDYDKDKYVDGETSYVVASSMNVHGTPETLVFATDEHGHVLSWLEVAGGRGDMTHADALAMLYAE